eukprot:CAMPEP_0168586862 /NCGR_PEP_ID=MMETSP0420-20121227/4534_1 /TAXON_ID=498008 /ORGANISM="Pessonella sp." /LENGTH=93 /DNA_ID=CAMNT_0008622029 /DNA_START=445 /DNA_END=723 /DNA_ORIENTATION=+
MSSCLLLLSDCDTISVLLETPSGQPLVDVTLVRKDAALAATAIGAQYDDRLTVPDYNNGRMEAVLDQFASHLYCAQAVTEFHYTCFLLGHGLP